MTYQGTISTVMAKYESACRAAEYFGVRRRALEAQGEAGSESFSELVQQERIAVVLREAMRDVVLTFERGDRERCGRAGVAAAALGAAEGARACASAANEKSMHDAVVRCESS